VAPGPPDWELGVRLSALASCYVHIQVLSAAFRVVSNLTSSISCPSTVTRHILSSYSASSLNLLAGSIHLDNGGKVHQIQQIVVHEGYNENDSWRNDIAVIEVWTRVHSVIKSLRLRSLSFDP
jgi:hypothetical protein